MENCAYRRGREIPSPNASSPNSSTTSSSSSSSNGASLPPKAAAAPLANVSSAPVTPKSIPRTFDANPYPTTFIQADTSSFKQVVQMLTGSAETTAKHAVAATSTAPKSSIPPSGKPTGPKKPAFKLYERRGSMKSLKMINPMIPSFAGRSNPNSPVTAFSPRKLPEILSPSMLDLPSLALSPVTPLFPDPFDRDAFMAEERAIAEKGFYFHPSRRMTPRDAEPPRLLPLFPVSSPEISSSSST
ncbi:hypothetical protein KSP40_PGU022146 [Platanthera guangdongensis]|uniref:VQ domain-containing protein n=1 Tax=Platanthera guangdongensis TaxID=2320717 RepID=A0ABR2M4P9_9ASPA